MSLWRGLGILVLVFVLGAFWEAQSLADAKFGAHYSFQHLWVGGLAALCSAAVCLIVGWLLYGGKKKGNANKKRSHDLLFIPMIWWSPILAITGVVLVGYDFHEFMAKVTVMF
jgi:hypothetical protein